MYLSYGDLVPKSLYGKIVGSIGSVIGILVIALPIFIVTNNFNGIFSNKQRYEKLKQQKVC